MPTFKKRYSRNSQYTFDSLSSFVVGFFGVLLLCTVLTSKLFSSQPVEKLQSPRPRGFENREFLSAKDFERENHYIPTELDAVIGSINELDGCFHIYLDVGSNVGIQVRKLFEPELYPDAPILPVFESYFGPILTDGQRENTVCAIGFEPNVHHTKALKDVEQAHKACGWRSHFYTETAAAHDYGTISFLSDNDFGNLEWGGSIISDQRSYDGTIIGNATKIRLSDYVFERILTRNIPESISNEYPSIIMKVDIEGSELEVLTDMVVSGALQV